MSKIANDIMKDVCLLSFKDELEKISILNVSNINYQTLNEEQMNQLAIKIGLLPLEYRNILFFRYCFNITPSETDKILGIENAKGKLRYTQKMLSSFMGLDGLWIDDSSMKRACEIALVEDTKDYDNTQTLHKLKYSKLFKRKLKDINIKQNPKDIFISLAKRAAVILLVCFLSFSSILVVNAEAREKVFDWIIEVFPRFSVFTPKNIYENANTVELTSLKINYIPNGFEMVDIHEGRSMLIYEYLSDNDQELIIKLLSPNGKGKSYYDTENAEIEEFIFKDSKAFIWHIDKMTYLIWHQDGIECHISGSLSKEEILKVAENISN